MVLWRDYPKSTRSGFGELSLPVLAHRDHRAQPRCRGRPARGWTRIGRPSGFVDVRGSRPCVLSLAAW